MDYSLLIGVKRERFKVLQNGSAVPLSGSSVGASTSVPPDVLQTLLLTSKDESGGYRALVVDGPGCYYIGLIDILQGWTWKKRIERFFKVYCQFKDGNGISALPPVPYADRFMRRCVLDTFEGMNDMKFLFDNVLPTATTSLAFPPSTIVSNPAIVGDDGY